MQRRTFIGFALAWAGASRAGNQPTKTPLRIGLTPVFLNDLAGFLRRWHEYLEARLARPVEFIQRGTYREIVALLRQDKCDIAWLCGYPYVRNRPQLRLLAVPLFEGRPLYRSYLIVSDRDGATQSLLDLRGRVFAFSDPDSNSGYLYPNYRLISLRERPDAFFGRRFFTWAHSKVVEAVAANVADGGAVDGYVWETLARFQPQLTHGTRVVERSPEFGFPPFVARASLPNRTFLDIRDVLLTMDGDERGRDLLGALNLTGFVAGDDALFASIERMARTMGEHARATAA